MWRPVYLLAELVSRDTVVTPNNRLEPPAAAPAAAARARVRLAIVISPLSTDANGSQTPGRQAFADRMSWRILKPVAEESRPSENERTLAAPEDWSYEGLADPATQFNGQAAARVYSASIRFRRLA